MFFCPKKQFTTDKLLLFLDKRTEEQKNSFYQTLYFHIPLLSFLFFCPQKIYSPFVLMFLCLKKLLFLILYIHLSKKTYPPYALLSKITQNPPVAFPPLSISIGSLPAATPVSASHNPRQYPFPAFPNGSRNPPTCPNHPH